MGFHFQSQKSSYSFHLVNVTIKVRFWVLWVYFSIEVYSEYSLMFYKVLTQYKRYFIQIFTLRNLFCISHSRSFIFNLTKLKLLKRERLLFLLNETKVASKRAPKKLHSEPKLKFRTTHAPSRVTAYTSKRM